MFKEGKSFRLMSEVDRKEVHRKAFYEIFQWFGNVIEFRTVEIGCQRVSITEANIEIFQQVIQHRPWVYVRLIPADT